MAYGYKLCVPCAEVLKDLAEDLISGQYADKERAVAMLSSMTMYIDHHDVLLESGVLPALLKTVSSSKIEPTVGPHCVCSCIIYTSSTVTCGMHVASNITALQHKCMPEFVQNLA